MLMLAILSDRRRRGVHGGAAPVVAQGDPAAQQGREDPGPRLHGDQLTGLRCRGEAAQKETSALRRRAVLPRPARGEAEHGPGDAGRDGAVTGEPRRVTGTGTGTGTAGVAEERPVECAWGWSPVPTMVAASRVRPANAATDCSRGSSALRWAMPAPAAAGAGRTLTRRCAGDRSRRSTAPA